MADVTKSSYLESNKFQKVIFQRGKNITDYELNEQQDIVRVQQYRALLEGVGSTLLNPASNDDGYRVSADGSANSVDILAGTLFANGVPVILDSAAVLSSFTTNPGPGDRTDRVYLAVTEVEVSDPEQTPQLGETSRRLQLQATLGIAEGVAIPSNTAQEIWEGGTHYFELASITRPASQAAINASEVSDSRKLLPASLFGLIVRQYGTTSAGDPNLYGNWPLSVGNNVASFGDFNGSTAIQDAFTMLEALGALTYTVYVKPGTYSFDPSAFTFGVSTVIRIIGESRETCTVNLTTPLTFSGKLELEGVTIGTTGTPSNRRINFTGAEAYASIRNCDLQRAQLFFSLTADVPNLWLEMENCIHDMSISGTDSNFHFNFPNSSSFEAQGIKVRDCTFSGPDTEPFIKFSRGGVGNDGTVREIDIQDSSVQLGAFSGAEVNVTTQNPGFFAFMESAHPDFRVINLRTKGLRVFADAGTDPTKGVLLFCAHDHTLAPASDSCVIDRFELIDSSWYFSENDATNNPFYLGRLSYEDSTKSPAFVSELYIENTEFVRCDYTSLRSTQGSSYGTYSGDLVYTPAGGTVDPEAFVFDVMRLVIKGVTLRYPSQESGVGDFLFRTSASEVDGLVVQRPYIANAGGGVPDYRIRTLNDVPATDTNLGAGYSHVFRGIRCMPDAPRSDYAAINANGCANNSFFFVNMDNDPNALVTEHQSRAFVQNCQVSHLDGNAFRCNDYTHYRDCQAVFCDFSGFVVLPGEDNPINDVLIDGCVSDYNGGWGILVTASGTGSTHKINHVLISNCHVANNGSEGIWVNVDNGAVLYNPKIMGCRVHTNNGGAANVQILFSDNVKGAITTTLFGVIVNNDCIPPVVGAAGTIQVRTTVNHNTIGLAADTEDAPTAVGAATAAKLVGAMNFNQAIFAK